MCAYDRCCLTSGMEAKRPYFRSYPFRKYRPNQLILVSFDSSGCLISENVWCGGVSGVYTVLIHPYLQQHKWRWTKSMENAVFRSLSALKLLDGFSKNCTVDYHRPHLTITFTWCVLGIRLSTSHWTWHSHQGHRRRSGIDDRMGARNSVRKLAMVVQPPDTAPRPGFPLVPLLF